MRRRSSSRRRERAHDVENKRRWRYWQRTSCPHAGMGTRWGIYWGPLHQAMSKKPLAVGEIVSLLPAVMLKAPADSAAYASSFFAPGGGARAPDHRELDARDRTGVRRPEHTDARGVEAVLTGACPRCPSVIERLPRSRIPVRVRDLVRDAAVGRERQGRRIGRAQVQRHAEFSGFGSMLTTVASRNKSRV